MRAVKGTFPTWSEAVALADLWTITLINGTVLRWTSADVPLTANGAAYSLGPIITRGSTRLTATLEVDTLDVTFETGGAQGGFTIQGIPFPHAATNGALDGATVKLERAFMAQWGVVSATVHLFEGRVAGVEPTHTEVRLQVKSLLEVLDAKWPRNLYQPTCNHQLYGQGCGVVRASYQVTGTATGGSATRIDWATNKPDGYYDQGVIAFTGGRNAGARRMVKTSPTTGLTVALPFTYPIQAGDTFTVAPGCTKSNVRPAGEARPSCTEFNNTARFRGFPWVPPPETAR